MTRPRASHQKTQVRGWHRSLRIYRAQNPSLDLPNAVRGSLSTILHSRQPKAASRWATKGLDVAQVGLGVPGDYCQRPAEVAVRHADHCAVFDAGEPHAALLTSSG